MEFFKTCKTLPMYNFNEVLRTNDYRFLSKTFDEFEDEEFKFGVEETIEARGLWRELLYEYSALTANRNIILNYQAQIKIVEQEFKYMIITKVLNNYAEFGFVEVLDILNNVEGVNFDIKGNIESQVVRLVSTAKRLKTGIAILKLKFEEKFKKRGYKDEEAIDNLDEEAIQLEVALKISYSIDTRKTSVSKWVKMWKVAAKMNKPLNTK